MEVPLPTRWPVCGELLISPESAIRHTQVNLIVAGMIVDAINSGELHGMTPVAIFDLAWVGLPAAVCGELLISAESAIRHTQVPPGGRAMRDNCANSY